MARCERFPVHTIVALARKRSLELVVSLIVYVGDLVAFTPLMVNTSSVQLGVNPFTNLPFFLVIRTLSPTWNLGDVAFRALTLA